LRMMMPISARTPRIATKPSGVPVGMSASTHADHAHACAQRYTRVLLRPRTTVGGGLPAMLFLKRPISD
ncbi:cytochrome P450, partial [Pseudomonas viridiflava]|uniref:cytochrome P450 n=1 Tax=Pseudomonas viridiflava TaxID=33069 RepID=UPI001E3548C7